MTGVTTAYLLKRQGATVAVLERDRCGGGDTSATSAHLTLVTDRLPSELVKQLGKDRAAAVWDAGDAAIRTIEDTVRREKIDCDFARVPGFLSASLEANDDERDALWAEAEFAHAMGYTATYVDVVPVYRRSGIRFPDQARFHPLKYLRGLLERIPGDGSYVFEGTDVQDVGSDPPSITVGGRTVTANRVVIATDVPLQGMRNLVGATLFQTKIQPYSSYAIGATVPKGFVPDVLLWDTSDPYFFLRLEPGAIEDVVVFGGADHKTGQVTDTDACYRKLEARLASLVSGAVVRHRWSGQVIETIDGLPYIGENAPNEFVATGFSGNGLTFGTAAAVMAADWVKGIFNPWADLFAPNRKSVRSAGEYVRENLDYPYYMLRDRLRRAEDGTIDALRPGKGKLLRIEGRRLAVYRDPAGAVTVLSPVCTHMGCIVRWNSAETTWDCPCHGSRFRATGEVMAGPAETNLEKQPAPNSE
jgi:glycine/D-amino acid oxidase-like deaminating enzyme/nitrite reductase/ring-hydroxylating ferredoxin subunit